ncbi:Os07g0188100 [Oryza sativa Japonica Group]|jgi:Ca2+/H+ antiporter|uniref:Uncharacterized protein n=8 Tax=Oryza TaxID=4527 RepID=A0A0P0X3A8_ORYSJ|nr:hypothetical protein OsI_25184 [Oryza sativa Indica Group]BAC83910.1 hypothetical protein [Oryza sativa Japonica Group]BAD31844.1 hypothetical protein [Oryza sativa Japonica Group]BAT00390.1 Os07g0188100 [Oryza sativa Japonica Group]
MAPRRRVRLICSAVSLALYTAFLAFYLLCATGRSFRGVVLGPGAGGVPPHVELAWKLANWVAVLLCCVVYAYLVSSIVVSCRRSGKPAAAPAGLPPPPVQMDIC